MATDSTLGITMDGSAYLSNQGRFKSGRPKGVVVHTLECDPIPHIAEQLSERGGYLDNQGLAPQRMCDPVGLVRTIPDGTVGGHVGAAGNPLFVGVETAGRAGMSRGEWLNGGNAQASLDKSARAAAGLFILYGHGIARIEWLSGAQIKAAANGADIFGLLGHVDVSVHLGGTSHWDPGLPEDFPFAWYRDRVQHWYRVLTGDKPPPPPEKEWDEMATRDEIRDVVGEVVNAKLDGIMNYVKNADVAAWMKTLDDRPAMDVLLNIDRQSSQQSFITGDMSTVKDLVAWTNYVAEQNAAILRAIAAAQGVDYDHLEPKTQGK